MAISYNLRQLGRRMDQIADAAEDSMDKYVRRLFLAVDAAVVMATPIDTGRARGNWLPSKGAPVTSDRPDQIGAGAAIEQARSVAASASARDTLWLSNNLPYIARLNAGWSQQAPAGFVELSIDNGIRASRSAPFDLEVRRG